MYELSNFFRDDEKYCLTPLETKHVGLYNDTLVMYVVQGDAPQTPHKHNTKQVTHSEGVRQPP